MHKKPAPAVITARIGLMWIDPGSFEELFDDHTSESLATAS